LLLLGQELGVRNESEELKREDYVRLGIKATITHQGNDLDYRYKTGPAKGLQRAEIWVPKHETTLLPYKQNQYPVSIVLVIGQDEYGATLRFAPSQKAAWVSSVLTKGRFEQLVLALQLGGFNISQYVLLQVEGSKIWVF
jgi:hypothetical protein